MQQVLHYRTMRRAVEVYRMGQKGIDIFVKHPVLLETLIEARKAQDPHHTWREDILATMHEMPTEGEER